jgi:hypothetical protein
MLDTDPYKDIVRRAYKTVLDRQPDAVGLSTYTNALMYGSITEEQLYDILKSSAEYRQRHVSLNISKAESFKGSIGYIQCIYDNDYFNCMLNLSAFKTNDPSIQCIVVYDDTISEHQITELQKAGAYCKYAKWLDDLPRQRNIALQVARMLKCQWVISSDPDEHFTDDLIHDVRNIIGSAIKQGFDLIKINRQDFDKDNNIKMNSDYYKDLIYELKHGVAYQGYGNLPVWHEGIFGLNKAVRCPKPYAYIHTKSRSEMLEHHVQGMFIVGGGPNLGAENPSWLSLRRITDILHINTWDEFKQYLLKPNANERLKEWMIEHRNDNSKDGDQNARSVFQYYFEQLHPEENTDKLTCIDFTIRPQ